MRPDGWRKQPLEQQAGFKGLAGAPHRGQECSLSHSFVPLARVPTID